MLHYIILLNFTDHGIRNVKGTIERADAFRAAIEKAGAKFISEYYTFGKYDIVTIVEAPNDGIIMSVILSTESLGNVRSETLKAFSMEEAAKIIEKLS